MVDIELEISETAATAGQSGDAFHLPIITADLGTHDTYTVSINKIMETKPVLLDGIRIHNTMADSGVYGVDLEDNPEFYSLRDYVLTAVDVNQIATDAYGSDWLDRDSVPIGSLAEQVYGTISTDSEKPTAIITSTEDIYGDGATALDLLQNGPKNELFLYPGQALTFRVTTSRSMQIGLKAPRAATGYSLQYAVGSTVTPVATNAPLATSVDMFYALNNPIGTENTYTVTVTNTGSDILSVTDLKICDDPNAAFAPVTVETIEQLLKDAGLSNAEVSTQPPSSKPTTPNKPTAPNHQETSPKPEISYPTATPATFPLIRRIPTMAHITLRGKKVALAAVTKIQTPSSSYMIFAFRTDSAAPHGNWLLPAIPRLNAITLVIPLI